MAIVKFGPLVTGARGTIAGTILSANKTGPYARGWAKGPNPISPAQSIQRATIADKAQHWRAITQAQRDAWDVWAALPAQEKFNSLGESYFASGINWFVAINSRLDRAARATRDDPPALPRPGTPTLDTFRFNITSDVFPSRVTYPWETFFGVDIVIFIAVANSEGVLTKYSGWRLLYAAPPTTENQTTFQDPLEASFGTIQLSQRAFCRVARQTTDGVRSSFATAYANAQEGA